MSGLVAYSSSSDEEDAEDVQRQPSSAHPPGLEQVPEQPQTLEAANETSELSNLSLSNAPMIGPTAPASVNGLTTSDDAETELSPNEPQQMPERDKIRYLTQTTHPMTSMPPSPPGSPDPDSNARFRRFLELKSKAVHFNEDLAGKSTFKNPSLFSTLMVRAGIEEDEQYSTSLPSRLWNPIGFPASAYKEQLLKSQQNVRDKGEAEKKLLSAAGKRTIDFASASRSGNSSRASTPGFQNKRRRP